MRKRSTLPVLALMVGLVACGLMSKPASASDEFAVQSLKALKGVTVIVESLDEDAQSLGLSKAQLQTEVELKLRLAGIRVLSMDEAIKEPGGPYLYVNLIVLKPISGTAAYTATLALKQSVRLERPVPDNSDGTSGAWLPGAATWNDTILGFGTESGIHKSLQTLMDEFLNDYLTANPKTRV